jgi:uncharacterized membrane protein YhaH (DUF805 family)
MNNMIGELVILFYITITHLLFLRWMVLTAKRIHDGEQRLTGIIIFIFTAGTILAICTNCIIFSI